MMDQSGMLMRRLGKTKTRFRELDVMEKYLERRVACLAKGVDGCFWAGKSDPKPIPKAPILVSDRKGERQTSIN